MVLGILGFSIFWFPFFQIVKNYSLNKFYWKTNMKIDNKEDKFKYMYGGSSIEKKLMYTQILFIF